LVAKRFCDLLSNFIVLPVVLCAALLSLVIPKRKDLWIFSSWEGKSFADNAKYLFIYVNKHHPEISAIWITKNSATKSEIEENDLPACTGYSLRGIWLQLRAKYFFTTHGIYDFIPSLVIGGAHIELFHVTFPIKKMEFDYEGFVPRPLIRKILLVVRYPFFFHRPAFSISTTDYLADVFASCLRLSRKNVLPFGHPRTEAFSSQRELKSDQRKLSLIAPLSEYSNIIYHVPTFRVNQDFDFFSFGFNLDRLTQFLKRTNSLYIVRLHPFDQRRVRVSNFGIESNFILEDHGLADPYPLLKRASVLITDYSSIFADFLLTDRPMIFANFAHDEYLRSERELYWDYERVTPGAKCANWEMVLDELEKLVVEKTDDYLEIRRRHRDKIFGDRIQDTCSPLVSHLIS